MRRPELWTELMELTPAERLELAEELWDSIEPREMPPLTEEQKQELDRRYAEHLRIRAERRSGRMSKRGYWRAISDPRANRLA